MVSGSAEALQLLALMDALAAAASLFLSGLRGRLPSLLYLCFDGPAWNRPADSHGVARLPAVEIYEEERCSEITGSPPT